MRYNQSGFQKQAAKHAKLRGNDDGGKCSQYWRKLREENARRAAAAA